MVTLAAVVSLSKRHFSQHKQIGKLDKISQPIALVFFKLNLQTEL